ncbi:MAG: hypothetical protein M3Z37_06080 [Candidatus Eremiobacteraeota bacterium]|nr:hypothetical protein [Candidatus Eremiobacteraeota bacterium]
MNPRSNTGGLIVGAMITGIAAAFIIVHTHNQMSNVGHSPGKHQYETALRPLEALTPGGRQDRIIRQRFDSLAAQMPALDNASLGPGIATLAWRTSPWAITMVRQRQDGALLPALAYGAGAGVNYQAYAAVAAGRIMPITRQRWHTIMRQEPASLIDQNESPVTCVDTRHAHSPYAVVGTAPTIAHVTKTELYRATHGLSNLRGTSFVCYHFGGADFLEFGTAGQGVLFRIVHNALVPVSRGYIQFADARGSLIIVHVRSTEGNGVQRTPVNEYLVGQPVSTRRSLR